MLQPGVYRLDRDLRNPLGGSSSNTRDALKRRELPAGTRIVVSSGLHEITIRATTTTPEAKGAFFAEGAPELTAWVTRHAVPGTSLADKLDTVLVRAVGPESPWTLSREVLARALDTGAISEETVARIVREVVESWDLGPLD